MNHELIGSDADSAILDGFRTMGYPASKELFAFRTDDFIVQWQAIRAGLGIGFVARYMAQTDADVIQILPDSLRIPPLPMWLAVHREIRSSQLIRSVYDFLAEALPPAI
jgi:DNA-binding transcriptional LysR family regulator